jgi:hypothetical protein
VIQWIDAINSSTNVPAEENWLSEDREFTLAVESDASARSNAIILP